MSSGVAANTARPVVEVQDLSVIFPADDQTVVALDRVSLSIAAGEFISLIGPSGCGKTTLLRVIADLEQASSGTVQVNGMSSREARLARAYGYVFQAPALFPWRTVLANVMLPLEIQGMARAQSRSVALDHLERVGLKGFDSKYPWQLSGGMQQRVAICRALITDPPLLLMDEPFAALDAMTREELAMELQRIARESRKTVIFVTHSIPESVLLADRVVVMSPRPGRIDRILDVDLPRPREIGMTATSAFGGIAEAVRARILTSRRAA